MTTKQISATSDDLQEARADLAVWCSPNEFASKIQALERQTSNYERFISPKVKFIRDAWVLAEFAIRQSADRVRLAKETERFPDGFVEVRGEILNVEITEADRSGRKRGDEYKPNALRVTCESINTAEDVAKALDDAIIKKLAKNYAPPPPTLVVNLNIGVHGNREEEEKVEARVAKIKNRHFSSFPNLFVLWNNRLL